MAGNKGRAGTPKPKMAAVAERRTKVLALAQAGVDYVQIGRQLHMGRWSGDGTPGDDGIEEWGEQLSTDAVIARLVRADLDHALRDRRAHMHEAADELVRQSVERLNRLRAAAWGKAMQGSVGHLRECARIEAQLAHLNGWNKPVKHALELPERVQEQVEAAAADLLSILASEAGKVPAAAALVSLPAAEG